MSAAIKRYFLDGDGTESDAAPSACETGGVIIACGIIPYRYDYPRARVPEGIEQQTELVMAHMKALLVQAKLDLDRVLAVDLVLANLPRDLARMEPIYRAAFGATALPARSCTGVAVLPEECLIQIGFTAVR